MKTYIKHFIIYILLTAVNSTLFADQFKFENTFLANYLEKNRFNSFNTFVLSLAVASDNISFLDQDRNKTNSLIFEVNPFFWLNNELNRFTVRYFINKSYVNNKLFAFTNNQIDLSYYILTYEILTLYIGYAIYNKYYVTVYDFIDNDSFNYSNNAKGFYIGSEVRLNSFVYLFYEYGRNKFLKTDFLANRETLTYNRNTFGIKIKVPVF